jgi:hypothetical protein
MEETTSSMSSAKIRLAQISGHLLYKHPEPLITSRSFEPIEQQPDINTDPSAVIIFGWGGSSPSHLRPYTKKYKSLYPSSRIVALGSPFTDMFPWPIRSQPQREEGFQELLAACADADNENGILVHVFSNSGSYRFANLATRYRLTTRKPLPIRAMVIDSAPCFSSVVDKANALTKGFSLSGPTQFFANVILSMVLSVSWAWTLLTWQHEPMQRTEEVLINPKIVRRAASRVYIYSKEDRIVHWKGIENSAKEADKHGYTVRLERFQGSQHVMHARQDPARYWSIVEGLWDEAVRGDENTKFEYGERDRAMLILNGWEPRA